MKYEQLLELLENLGGWPVLNKNWNGAEWTWEESLLLLHRFVDMDEKTKIFRAKRSVREDKKSFDNFNEPTSGVEESTKENYFEYMYSVAMLLGAPNNNATHFELQDALELGIALNKLMTKKFSKKSFLNATEYASAKVELQLLRWLELFDKSKITFGDSNWVNFNFTAQDNMRRLSKYLPKKTFANYVLWRVIDFSIQFLDNDIQEKILKLYRQSYGVFDKEQRWKLCTRMTNTYAELASGSLYIQEHFSNESRSSATEMANDIIKEFRRTIKGSSWMDEATQKDALKVVSNLTLFMGYDEKLLNIAEVEEYYCAHNERFYDSFYKLGLQLAVHKADKAFKHIYLREEDWTEYARPTSSRARYNKNDNTICE